MLPVGRLRFATRPDAIGSAPLANTIGIVVVAALAAYAAGVPLMAAMTATWRPTRSAASPASRSYRPSAKRYSIKTF